MIVMRYNFTSCSDRNNMELGLDFSSQEQDPEYDIVCVIMLGRYLVYFAEEANGLFHDT